MDVHAACYMGANGREGKKGQAERGKGVESSVQCVAREDEAVGCMAGRVRVVWVAGQQRKSSLLPLLHSRQELTPTCTVATRVPGS